MKKYLEVELQSLRNDLQKILQEQAVAKKVFDKLSKEHFDIVSKIKLQDKTITSIKQRIDTVEQQIKNFH